MPAYINGQQVNGCTNYASAVTCLDKDGNKSTVQAEMDELNKNMGGLRFGVDGDGNGGYYKADDSFVPFRKLLTSEQMSNVTTLVHTLSSAGVTWTTTEDVILKESTCQNGGWAFSLTIGGVTICKGGQGTAGATLNLPFVIPKGTEVRTANNATYNLKFYRPTR